MVGLSNTVRVISTLAFVVFCLAIGQVASALLTCLVYDLNTFQLFDILNDPTSADRHIVILLSLLYTSFSFLIIPIGYLLLTEKDSSERFGWWKSKIRLTPLLLSIVTVFTIIPFISILVELNHSIEFPIWLSGLEGYFKHGGESAGKLTASLLSFRGYWDLCIAILIMAVIPGIAEELFFRGIVQKELQGIFRNGYIAILAAAFLFSFFHFQFYEFFPRLIMGLLLGYIFALTKNVWYSCAAHVANNLLGVLGVYFFGPEFLNTDRGGSVAILLLLPSIAVTVLIILYLKRMERTKKLAAVTSI